jgi:hypothetical protein
MPDRLWIYNAYHTSVWLNNNSNPMIVINQLNTNQKILFMNINFVKKPKSYFIL